MLICFDGCADIHAGCQGCHIGRQGDIHVSFGLQTPKLNGGLMTHEICWFPAAFSAG
jgi:hypothetical protein